MIKSKQELRQVSERMSSRIKTDMRSKIVNFLEQMGTNEVELANALDIPVQEVSRILEGDGEITLTTFVKILIGSNHAIEIKPIGNVPQAARTSRRSAPVNREVPRRPSYEEFKQAIREGRIPPPPHGMHAPMGGPMMPPTNHDTMVGPMIPPTNHAAQHVQSMARPNLNDANMELESMTREELLNTIVQNGLAQDFEATIGRNVSLARRGDMINFLLGVNFNVRHEGTVLGEPVIEELVPQVSKANDEEVANLANVFASMLTSNPELKETLKRIL